MQVCLALRSTRGNRSSCRFASPYLAVWSSAVRRFFFTWPIESRQFLQPGAVQKVGWSDGGGLRSHQFQQGGAGKRWRERLAHRLEVLLFGLSVASRVGLDRRPPEFGQRRDPGENRGEGDAQTGPVCLVMGVGGDEALRRFGAGVSAAEG